ncbi:uncharacterized protein [Macaca nemestrina]|uniref:uncharacterized protein n=1 Tax=Macaca nemestrina TaxID=9545 RepID=UPI0039B9C8C3
MDSAPGGGRRWQREKAGRGSGWGVRNGERKKKKTQKLGIHGGAAPAGGAAYSVRFIESGGGARALVAGFLSPPARRRRRPHRTVRLVAPSGRRQEPPQVSPCGALRPRLQLLLSHHLAVTASQKRPHLAAASTRDGGSHCLSSGWEGGAEGFPRASKARGRGGFRPDSAARAAIGLGWGENEGKGLGWSLWGGGKRKKTHAYFPAALTASL